MTSTVSACGRARRCLHSSLSQLGYVAGGAQAVVLALLDAIGTVGTVGAVVMPAHS